MRWKKKFYYKYYNNSIPIVNTYYNLKKKGKYKKISYQFLVVNNYNNIKYKKYYNNTQYHKKIHLKKEDRFNGRI